jgi:hypothetical protein
MDSVEISSRVSQEGGSKVDGSKVDGSKVDGSKVGSSKVGGSELISSPGTTRSGRKYGKKQMWIASLLGRVVEL